MVQSPSAQENSQLKSVRVSTEDIKWVCEQDIAPGLCLLLAGRQLYPLGVDGVKPPSKRRQGFQRRLMSTVTMFQSELHCKHEARVSELKVKWKL